MRQALINLGAAIDFGQQNVSICKKNSPKATVLFTKFRILQTS